MSALPERRVAVIGAGIVGTCTAWYLRERGFEVDVLERRDGVARETSWGNAGVIAPGYVTPWAAPGMPRKVLSYLFAAEAPVLFRPVPSIALARWIGRWLGECELARYRVNKARMQRLAFHSRDALHGLRARLGIDDGRRQGYLQLLRSERDLAMTGPARALLEENGVPHRLLDADETRALEPALARGVPLAGALWLPEDESASCPDFAQALADAARTAGVRFVFGCTVRHIVAEGGVVRGLMADGPGGPDRPGPRPYDAVVVAGAVDALPLLAEHGIRLPIWPVKGYSTTLPLAEGDAGPRHAMIDEAYKVAITPFPGRIRVAGTAELGSAALVPRPAALRTLVKVGRDWFPEAARWQDATCWVGARPMTPDGPALLGATRIAGLYLNMGHGSTGWAMAAGAGQVVADVVAGRPPEIDLDGLTIERLR
ncbi:MAG: FAD-dependent oxidoreductase [Burkholderiales bacterium]|nr:MAG: FAD-dependent oxidoreductase [Burkholderiales bacterium]